MSTDAWVRIPHYNFVGYNDAGFIWGEPLGNVWVQVTSDGDTVLALLSKVLVQMDNSTYSSFRTPEGFTGQLVGAMYADGWDSVLVCLQEPEEGAEYSYTVDFKGKSVVVHGAINHRYTFRQVIRDAA